MVQALLRRLRKLECPGVRRQGRPPGGVAYEQGQAGGGAESAHRGGGGKGQKEPVSGQPLLWMTAAYLPPRGTLQSSIRPHQLGDGAGRQAQPYLAIRW